MMKKKPLLKNFMHGNRKKLLYVVGLLFMMTVSVSMSRAFAGTNGPASVAQQQITVSGTVIDETGEPVPGVNIVVKGASVGTVTGVDGKYSINAPDNNAVLVFSFIGYVEVERPIANQRQINVTLKEKEISIDEVVIVGYYNQNVRDVSTAVSKVNMKALENISATSLTSLLSGQAPGLQTVIRGGIPGMGGSGMVIRGNTSLSSDDGVNGLSNPLYIVDGIPMSLQDLAGFDVSQNDFLSSLNPDEIASISILKDAAATAIYGSRGANGVVILKTKRGTSGKARVTGRATLGVVATPPRLDVYIGEAERQAKLGYIQKTMENLFGEQAWIDVRNGMEVMGYLLPSVLTDKYNPYFNNAYDYQDMFYQSGFSQDYSLSMDGGTESNNYRVGLGLRDETGVLMGYGLSRLTLNASLLNSLARGVKNEFIMRYGFINREGGLNSYMRGVPTSPSDMLSSLFYRTPEELSMISGELGDAYNKNTSHDISFSETLTANLSKDFIWENLVGASIRFGSNDYFIPSTARSNNESYARSASGLGTTITGHSLLKYNHTFKEDHQLFALAAVELNTDARQYADMWAENGSSDYLKVIGGYKKEDINGTSNILKSNMLSYFGQLAYGYKDNRYYISATLRRDGSSEFGANNKWATFPSLMGYWAFSKESWMQKTSGWLNFGKIRASFGTSGEIPHDPTLQYNSLVPINNIGADINNIYGNKMDIKTYGGKNLVISQFNQVPNKSLSWAKSKEMNYGIDLEMFNNRLFINADFYSKYNSGMIYDSFLAPYIGYNSIRSNLVDMIINGFEIGATAYLFPRTSNFQWEWTLNLSKSNAIIAKLGNGGRDYIVGDYAFVVGRPAFQYYMWEYQGVLQDVNDLPVNPMTGRPLSIYGDMGLALNRQGEYFPGMPLFTDVDGDYRISGGDEDKTIIDNKSPEPKISGGLHTTIRYKGLSLRLQSSFAFGHYIFNTTLQEQLSKFDDCADFYARALYKFDESKFWQKPGDDAYYPMIYVAYSDGGGSQNFRKSSMFLEKGDYWNIENITLSYTIPTKLLSHLQLKGLNIYATGQDVWMWKKSGVFDPRRISKTGYYNGESYPMSRSFILGLQLQF
ncbi:MAG: SusC/RagA family TonB-linked outer membrane protein [Dysgonamonadaceae bacterium]|jgi:iron complex outermembrane receptor protein|nr:SusC/RagA family TonB-linked outer membrane protein [Dysgonamonadaceae bacterium]